MFPVRKHLARISALFFLSPKLFPHVLSDTLRKKKKLSSSEIRVNCTHARGNWRLITHSISLVSIEIIYESDGSKLHGVKDAWLDNLRLGG